MQIPMFIWVMLLAFGLSLMTQVVNKLVINEKKTDKYKQEIKQAQKELKGLDSKSKEYTEKQDALLDKNMWIMKQQFKPMMFTMIPYLIVFYFVSSLLAYDPMIVGSGVNIEIKGAGDFYSDCLGIDTEIKGTFKDNAVISSEECTAVFGSTELDLGLIGERNVKKFEAEGMKMTVKPPEKVYFNLPFSLPLAGNTLGWLGTFILSSLVSSLVLTKVLKGKYLRKWE